MKISKREIVLLFALFAIICGFLYYRMYFTPKMQEIENEDLEIEVLETNLRDIGIKAAVLEKLRVNLDEQRQEAGEKMSGVAEAIDQPDMLMMISEQIEGLSADSVYIFSRDYEQMEDCRKCSVEVMFRTNYESLRQILNNLGTSRFENRIVICNLSEAKASELDDYNIDAQLFVEFFTFGGSPSGDAYPFVTGNYPNGNLFP